tara:strand:+ start:1619 stop:1915 length:297 start_codon:yes stop_codon:yes gene_type:complete
MKLVISEKGRHGILIYNNSTGIGCVSIIGSGILSYTTNMIEQYKITTYTCNIEDLTQLELKQLLSNMEYLSNSPHINDFIKKKMIENIRIHERILHYS